MTKVLIVEDEISFSDALAYLLKKESFDVEVAVNGKEAIDLFNRINKGKYERDYDKWHKEKKWAYAPIELVKNNINQTQYT